MGKGVGNVQSHRISKCQRSPAEDLPGRLIHYDSLFVGIVPEPASMSLLALGGLAMLRGRR